jgi:hypothetical protein
VAREFLKRQAQACSRFRHGAELRSASRMGIMSSPTSLLSRVSKLTLLHYHGAFWPVMYDETLRRIAERTPERLDFVRSLRKIKLSRLNPVTRLRVRLLRCARQRRQEKYIATCRKVETPPLSNAVSAAK